MHRDLLDQLTKAFQELGIVPEVQIIKTPDEWVHHVEDNLMSYVHENKTNDYKLATFRTEWGALSDQDKKDLRTGIGDGSFNY